MSNLKEDEERAAYDDEYYLEFFLADMRILVDEIENDSSDKSHSFCLGEN